jgi:hypothetical protein
MALRRAAQCGVLIRGATPTSRPFKIHTSHKDTTMSSFDVLVKEQLSLLERNFFTSLNGDLETLNKSWLAFNELISSNANDLTEETKCSVSSFAEIGGIVASALLEVDTVSDCIHKELEQEITRIAEEELNSLSIQYPLIQQGTFFLSPTNF